MKSALIVLFALASPLIFMASAFARDEGLNKNGLLAEQALYVIGHGSQAAFGIAAGAATSWTGVGAVGGGLLAADGLADLAINLKNIDGILVQNKKPVANSLLGEGIYKASIMDGTNPKKAQMGADIGDIADSLVSFSSYEALPEGVQIAAISANSEKAIYAALASGSQALQSAKDILSSFHSTASSSANTQ
jgi:hypothetical protein